MATGRVTVTIFDFSDIDENGQPRITRGAMEYDKNADITEQGHLKVSVGVGDDVASAVVTAPMAVITQLLTGVMMQHDKEKHNGLVGFDKPSFKL